MNGRSTLKQKIAEFGTDRACLAERIGVPPVDVEFIQENGVAVSARMLRVLDFLGVADYESMEMARLSIFMGVPMAPAILASLVRSGYGSIEVIENLLIDGAGPPEGLSEIDVEAVKAGLRRYRRAEMLDDVDEA